MAPDLEPDPLPDAVIAAMRSLGGESAPAELAERVGLARWGEERHAAPPELWRRVAAELQLEKARPRGRVLSWTRWAAAAGVLLLAGLAWFMNSDLLGTRHPSLTAESGLAKEIPESMRRELLAGLVVREVPPEQLSPLTQGFMNGLSAPMRKEG